MMLSPPFKLATATAAAISGASGSLTAHPAGCCETSEPADNAAVDAAANGDGDVSARTDIAAQPSRMRLADLDTHLHCSVIGTCLSTSELRKLMARFLFVRDADDLEIHHEAVSMAGRGGLVTKALQKLLDQRHEAVIQRFARARDAQSVAAMWEEALRLGEIPGAYWAVLTHRHASVELRQKVFGDVHMLSHLVGAANRADIRRLVALERDNTELRERLDRQQLRSQELLENRDHTIASLRDELAEMANTLAQSKAAQAEQVPVQSSSIYGAREGESAAAMIALQTERRERAELAAATSAEEANRLRDELEHLGQHVSTLQRELAAAETQLREMGDAEKASTERPLDLALRGRKILYVGGRPSSMPAIRELTVRHGGEFQRHDGGLEDRKGLLASSVAWAGLVVFPVDCIDHDSASNLKRICARHGVAFVPLRSASVASFAAGISSPSEPGGGPDRAGPSICMKHG